MRACLELEDFTGAAYWSTHRVNRAGDPLTVEEWNDPERADLYLRTTSTYDANGLLVEETYHSAFGGSDDRRHTWERGALGEVLEFLRHEVDASGAWQITSRSTYTYEDGLLTTLESDDWGGGTIDTRDRYTYADRRPVERKRERVSESGVSVTVWTYPFPAPSLDHVEVTAGAEGEDGPTTRAACSPRGSRSRTSGTTASWTGYATARGSGRVGDRSFGSPAPGRRPRRVSV